MKLSDYLRANRGSLLGQKNFFGEYAYLNSVKVPSPPKIWSHQKRIFKTMYGIENNPIQTSFIMKELQLDLMGKSPTISNFWKRIDENITNIEKRVQTLNSESVDKILEESEKNFNINSVDKLIQDYKIFLSNLKNMKSLKEVSFAIIPLENQIVGLQKIASAIANGELPPAGSLKNRISWIEYVLKGEYLEQEGVEFFKERLPRHYILHTGSLKGYYDINKRFKTSGAMKEDIMIFDNPNFMISFTIGKDDTVKKMTLKEFIDFLDKLESKKTIKLTQEGYDALLKHTVSAVQAKATRMSSIKFGNINVRSASNEIQGQALVGLKDIYQSAKTTTFKNAKGTTVKRKESPLLAKHPDYDALFNYNLAKNITHVIGKNNLLLTRNGISDMYTYVMEQFEAGRYFYGIDITLANNKGNKVAL